MKKENTQFVPELIKAPSNKTAENGIVKFSRNKLIFFNIPWIKETYKKNCKKADENSQYEVKVVGPRFDINNFELCKKTKALIGGLFIGSVVGTAYYFNWFKKK